MMLQFDIYGWSPNLLSTIPYHLQLKVVICRAIEDGRFPQDTPLSQLRRIGTSSLCRREYVRKAYELLVAEGKLSYIPGRGFCVVNISSKVKKIIKNAVYA